MPTIAAREPTEARLPSTRPEVSRVARHMPSAGLSGIQIWFPRLAMTETASSAA